jgi:hypothetical protein
MRLALEKIIVCGVSFKELKPKELSDLLLYCMKRMATLKRRKKKAAKKESLIPNPTRPRSDANAPAW